MSDGGCEFWPEGVRCGGPVVETLVFCNPNINSHVHSDGSLRCCSGCLADYFREALL